MKKRMLILLLVVGFFVEAGAQHCAWDFTSIIMVDVKQKGGDQAIGGLRITLVDSAGRCVSTYEDSCVQFAQNIPTTNTQIRYLRQSDLKHQRPSFFFMEEQYLVLVYSRWKNANLYVKVEDIDGENNGGYFESVIVPVKKENLLSLCSDLWCLRNNPACADSSMIRIALGDSITFGKRREEVQGDTKMVPFALLCVYFALFAVKQPQTRNHKQETLEETLN